MSAQTISFPTMGKQTSAVRNKRARERYARGKIVLQIEVDAAELAKTLYDARLLDHAWCEDRVKLARALEKFLDHIDEPLEG